MSSSNEATAAGEHLGTGTYGRTEHAQGTDGFPTLLGPGRRTTLAVGAIVVVLGIESAMIAPYVRRAAAQLTHADVKWLLPALACELFSMMMFARLQRHALGAGGLHVGLGPAAATVFAGNAVGSTLPGGSLVSITYRTHRMRSWGASASQIGFAHAATGVVSTVALALLAGVSRTLAGERSQLLSVAAEVGVICALTSAALAVLHHPALLRRPVRAVFRLVRRLRRGAVQQTSADLLLDELASMHPPARFWGQGLGLALANWSSDFACLLAVCHAVGARPALSTALLAYVAGMTATSAMSLLPAGIGAFDAAVVLTLHHDGLPTGVATAADLLYRMITPGLIAVAGWVLIVRQRRQRKTNVRVEAFQHG
jgi:uncharacterized membrane protein YbhN (UPF0104 family)